MSWALEKLWIRTFQAVFYTAAYLLPWGEPELIEGNGSIRKLAKVVKDKGYKNPMIVTDKSLMKLNLLASLFETLDEQGVPYVLFDEVEPNPKTNDIERAVELYKKSACDCMIAFGGGSSIDTAKAVGARLARPKKSLQKMGGTLKVLRPIPMLFVIPTTAGTGSEVTVASVVTDSVTHHKYSINDLFLVPKYAVMDPELTAGLPKFITATTGMDALTHATEAYITRSVPKKYKKFCEDAVQMIFANIETAYNDGKNLDARKQMLYASFYAGAAFTRCGVTYVHPIAHTLGGLYGVPHGLANAVILPYCLEAYGSPIYGKLARLADLVGIKGASEEEKAKAFIQAIRDKNKAMGLQDKFDCIQEKDIPQMVEWALHEAHPLYQSPVLLNAQQLTDIIHEIMVK